jgi:hypothetical protein
MSDSELLGLRQPKYRGMNRWPKPRSGSTKRMPRNCLGWSRSGCGIWSSKRSWRGGLETLTRFYWRSIRMLDTTARISCGSAPAIRALSMWTGSWSHHRCAGTGCARRLYRDLFEHAAEAGHERVVCEVNSSPPNPASDAFHAALGFVEVGTASVYDGSRTVQYLSHALSTPDVVSMPR